MSNSDFFEYNIPPFCFLERARELITRFDRGDIASIFYAALELRMGIEAKLFQTIESAIKLERLPEKKIKEYSATKLLKKLASINPDAEESVAISFGLAGSNSRTRMEYTPVTPELAKKHGMLGGYLHYNFFRRNPYWFYNVKTEKSGESVTLNRLREILEEVALELEKATSGSLLSPPTGFMSKRFLKKMDELNTEPESSMD